MPAVKAPGFGDRRKPCLRILPFSLVAGHHGGARHQTGECELEDLGAPRRSPSTRTTRRSSRVPARPARSKPISSSVCRLRDHLGLRQGKAQERLAKLLGRCDHQSGAATETELKEKKARVEDACTPPVRRLRKACLGRALPFCAACRLEKLKLHDENPSG